MRTTERPSSRYSRFAKLFLGLGIPALIFIYTALFYRNSFLGVYVLGFSVLVIMLSLLALWVKNRFTRFLQGAVSMLGITYILLEISTYFLLSFNVIRPDLRFFFGGIVATDQPSVVYDTLAGYRCTGDRFRFMVINNGKCEMDHRVRANRQGWFSERDYTYKKTRGKTFRYMVLGDSFSSGTVAPRTWVDVVHERLGRQNRDSVELYNFSLDGAGIVNWYRIFTMEIVPKYEFDGIIIAASAEKGGVPDFDRNFITAATVEGSTYMKVLPWTGGPVPERFSTEDAAPVTAIWPNDKLDKIKNGYNKSASGIRYTYQSPDLTFLSTFLGAADGLHKMFRLFAGMQAYTQPNEKYESLADSTYRMAYFDQRYKYGFMFKEIIAYCKSHDKAVVLAGIPDVANAVDMVHGQKIIYRHEFAFLAAQYGLTYFDGFRIFENASEADIKAHFHEFDEHWNQDGINLFAEQILKHKAL